MPTSSRRRGTSARRHAPLRYDTDETSAYTTGYSSGDGCESASYSDDRRHAVAVPRHRAQPSPRPVTPRRQQATPATPRDRSTTKSPVASPASPHSRRRKGGAVAANADRNTIDSLLDELERTRDTTQQLLDLAGRREAREGSFDPSRGYSSSPDRSGVVVRISRVSDQSQRLHTRAIMAEAADRVEAGAATPRDRNQGQERAAQPLTAGAPPPATAAIVASREAQLREEERAERRSRGRAPATRVIETLKEYREDQRAVDAAQAAPHVAESRSASSPPPASRPTPGNHERAQEGRAAGGGEASPPPAGSPRGPEHNGSSPASAAPPGPNAAGSRGLFTEAGSGASPHGVRWVMTAPAHMSQPSQRVMAQSFAVSKPEPGPPTPNQRRSAPQPAAVPPPTASSRSDGAVNVSVPGTPRDETPRRGPPPPPPRSPRVLPSPRDLSAPGTQLRVETVDGQTWRQKRAPQPDTRIFWKCDETGAKAWHLPAAR